MSEIELEEFGKDKILNYDNLKEYISLIKEYRLTELLTNTIDIREGILSIIPEMALNLLTAKDLQKIVCYENKHTIESYSRFSYLFDE